MSRLIRAITVTGGVLAAAWAGGFVWFVADVMRPARPADAGAQEKADGIVVLTGGADRIATGMRLLQDGCCGRLLISGVGHGAALTALLRGTGVSADPLAEHITLGRAATSTAGNADETAAWAHANHVHSLIVVTAYYHMPRALFELSRTAPDLRLIPAPVQRGAGGLAMLPMLAHEYTKFLGSAVGLTLLEHSHDSDRTRPDRHHA